ncbi:hypothetical protein DFH09DRAFT_1337350 [Mycena vulgaris]|nr:hypothetical protein DFH09DRAFT_1337350 [Mycena vulgaris]
MKNIEVVAGTKHIRHVVRSAAPMIGPVARNFCLPSRIPSGLVYPTLTIALDCASPPATSATPALTHLPPSFPPSPTIGMPGARCSTILTRAALPTLYPDLSPANSTLPPYEIPPFLRSKRSQPFLFPTTAFAVGSLPLYASEFSSCIRRFTRTPTGAITFDS